MDAGVKQSIEARKDAIINTYKLNDALNAKLSALFDQMEVFGETCKDSLDFEKKFSSHSLNQEYIVLFTKVATSCQPLSLEGLQEEVAKEAMIDEAKEQIDSLGRPIRMQARQELDNQMRNAPILGEILEVKQHADLFHKFRKKREK